jgi:type IV pilus assembly protein PilX
MTSRISAFDRNPRLRQRGAALVVGLLLLVIITLLAITGMTTANTELIMAGNEQQRQNGFRAAENGVDEAIRDVEEVGTSTNACRKTGPRTVFATTDRFTTGTLYAGTGGIQPGWGAETSAAYFFAIRSRGAGARGAETELHQGVVKMLPVGSGSGTTLTALHDPVVNPLGQCVPDVLN